MSISRVKGLNLYSCRFITGKELLYPLRLDEPRSLSGRLGAEKNLLPSPVFEPWRSRP